MKKKYFRLIILLSVYLGGFILCKFYFAQGMPRASYTAGWLYRRSFMYTWVAVILFIAFNKPISATYTTIGCFLGIFIGDIFGGWIRAVRIERLQELIDSGVAVSEYKKVQVYQHYGILPIWFIVIITFIVIGLILDRTESSKI